MLGPRRRDWSCTVALNPSPPCPLVPPGLVTCIWVCGPAGLTLMNFKWLSSESSGDPGRCTVSTMGAARLSVGVRTAAAHLLACEKRWSGEHHTTAILAKR
jgi:hypothetical protein